MMGNHGWQFGARTYRQRRGLTRDRVRPARQDLDLGLHAARAQEAALLGSFERNLVTGETVYSECARAILGVAGGTDDGHDPLLEQVEPEDRQQVERWIERARTEHEPFDFDARICPLNGPTRTIRVRGVLPAAKPSILVGTIQDVTHELKERSARELLSNLVESTEDAILTKDLEGTIRSWNKGAEVLYGYRAEEAIGSPVTILEAPELKGEQEAIARRVFEGGSVERLETERVRKDGRRIKVSLTISPVRDATGEVALASIIARDITDRKRYEERLQYLADHDQLTGLLNRRRFEEELKRELARAGRRSSPGAVLSIDIDNFKSINDSAGHAAGDAVLVEVARVLTRRFRASDVVARVGGDEFSVLLTDVTPEQARSAAYDLLGAIISSCRPMFGGRLLRVAVSIGIAAFESDDATSDEVRVHADLAMYQAKSSGGDGVVLYSTSEGQKARTLMRQPWSERIRDALERDRFVLHCQPILNLETKEISHGELLLRMQDDRGELIAPEAFLPVAERQGLIHDVDRWVVRRALELLADDARPPLDCVAMNLSGDSVARDPQLLRVIERELKRTGVDPASLIFEVTETAAIANMPEASLFAAGLRELGCSLALDDFGTGFGSFYYLKYLPVGYVKLDGEFIRNLPRSPVDEHVVQAIVGVARGLGIKTVAESVSDAETIELLEQFGVDYAQGFYVGEPEPLSVFS